MKTKSIILAVLLILGVAACEKNANPDLIGPLSDEPVFRELPVLTNSSALKSTSNYPVEIYMAEYYTTGEGGKIGKLVFFSNTGNKKLGADFVPFDNGEFDGNQDITYYIDNTRPSSDVDVGASSAAIERAMTTWDNITCSDFGLTQIPSDGRPTGYVAALIGYQGGNFAVWADLTHCGWLDGAFFDELAPDGSGFILGVTFTLIWADSNGPTDIDNNKKQDVAFREIYFNDAFNWAVGDHYDIETVALHEAGHGLSQGHFGKAFITPKNGKIHFSPRAVMNASYSGIQTEILKTDNAGHCSIWANWSQN
jgi:hypothetical protein